MHNLKKSLFIFLLPLFAFTIAHKFYVSVTNINYSKKDDALQITSRIFIDDMEALLKERYDLDAHLATEDESKVAQEYLEKYLRAKFVVEVDNQQKTYNYIGKKYDNDVMIIYLEIQNMKLETVKSIQIQNEILTDLYDEQQNILHYKIAGAKKSFVLMKENTKGVLKL